MNLSHVAERPFFFVAHLRLRFSILSMASKYVDLIKVVIAYVVVRKNDNTQLKSMELV